MQSFWSGSRGKEAYRSLICRRIPFPKVSNYRHDFARCQIIRAACQTRRGLDHPSISQGQGLLRGAYIFSSAPLWLYLRLSLVLQALDELSSPIGFIVLIAYISLSNCGQLCCLVWQGSMKTMNSIVKPLMGLCVFQTCRLQLADASRKGRGAGATDIAAVQRQNCMDTSS